MSQNSTKQQRIAAAMHVLVDEFFAPYLATLADPSRQIDVIEADLTKTQAGKALGLSPRTIERKIKNSEIRAIDLKGQVRIPQSEIERYRQHNGK